MIKEAIMDARSIKSQAGQTKVKKGCNCGGRGNPIKATVISQSTHKSANKQIILNTKELTPLNNENSHTQNDVKGNNHTPLPVKYRAKEDIEIDRELKPEKDNNDINLYEKIKNYFMRMIDRIKRFG